ncbi:MAG: 16S rRNA pseudouridine(516) synthase [Arenimonas sp.]
MKLVKHISNLGYGSRKEVTLMFREGRITDAAGEVLYADDITTHENVRVDEEPLDPTSGMILMLHKPAGYTCSTKDKGRLVYDLLPDRFRIRKPVLAPIGRLDKETTGLLLMTDDGDLLHRIISPKNKLPKIYEAELASPLRGDEVELFASGEMMLETENSPLAPAVLQPISELRVRLTIIEGRYHQIRRMFAVVGNHVVKLHRSEIGGLNLGSLPVGEYRLLDALDQAKLFVKE